MVRPKNKEEADNWYIVEDRKQRKRIQDRLAQRARRKRLAELKIGRSGKDPVVAENASLLALSTSAGGHPALREEMSLGCNSPVGSLIPIPPAKGKPLEIELSMNVWTALYLNGSIMGLSCSTAYPAKSRPVDPSIPSTLQPTVLQLMTIHPTWIDRFPFPEMRDNLINAISLVEEEDFLRDLFCMSSFKIKPGGATWDPDAWIIGEAFRSRSKIEVNWTLIRNHEYYSVTCPTM
ncbi:hypothetical protein EYB26_005136 [Talaromyces marneffei]|uniref:uncharacterized protein n=1 Tax=Talaromyces marneffei TaxID=37727 RepID=UPI0012A8B181|nr:uncharacterized protein EYB26_005136 [Talaromyces marneffei]QGA17465.1 hypothetical protein EYB26_005136 [Talaromyces marneffei]